MIFCEGLLKNNITQTPGGATRLRIISGYATPGVAATFPTPFLQIVYTLSA